MVDVVDKATQAAIVNTYRWTTKSFATDLAQKPPIGLKPSERIAVRPFIAMHRVFDRPNVGSNASISDNVWPCSTMKRNGPRSNVKWDRTRISILPNKTSLIASCQCTPLLLGLAALP